MWKPVIGRVCHGKELTQLKGTNACVVVLSMKMNVLNLVNLKMSSAPTFLEANSKRSNLSLRLIRNLKEVMFQLSNVSNLKTLQ